MTILNEMTMYWSYHITKGIAQKTQILLESKNNVLANTDTCLENNWEGFCVQAQSEQITMKKDEGVQEIHSFFNRYYEALPIEEQFTLWLQSDAGQAWSLLSNNNINDTFTYEAVPTDFDDCISLLMGALIETAMDFRNDNITNFIEFDCNGIEEEEDDYEEEEDEYDE